MPNSWQTYCPKIFHEEICEFIHQHQVTIKLFKPRTSKFGDFRVSKTRQLSITLNNDLGKLHGTLTFFHELAHAEVYISGAKKAKPHGKEWKHAYKQWLLKALHHRVFNPEDERLVAHHAQHIKSSSCYDYTLMKHIQAETCSNHNEQLITQLSPGSEFEFKGRRFRVDHKRRTRFLCIELANNKSYLFSPSALVTKLHST